jgi:CubicO group peptidase (beta-lactamase class C family)
VCLKVYQIREIRVHKAIILTILTVAISFSPLLLSKEMKSQNENIKTILNSLVSSNEPGLQYVVVDKASVLFESSLGLSDVKQQKQLVLNQMMASFSMTKTITAIAILQLVENGKINLEDKASKFVKHPYHSAITIKQLINHTSGIPNPIPLKWVHLAKMHSEFNEKKALKSILDKHPNSEGTPNTNYKYSNIGYWLLGEIVEKVSGQKYTAYITQNIFNKLGLTSEEIGFLIKNNSTKGYLKKWSFMNIFGRFFVDKNTLGAIEGKWININDVYLNGASFGGIFGSAKAFSRILQDLLSIESKLLGAMGKKLLYSQQSLVSGKKIDMTLGWHISKLGSTTYYYKEGGGAGFHCEMRIYPKQGIASVIMANRTSFNSRKILSTLDINFIK